MYRPRDITPGTDIATQASSKPEGCCAICDANPNCRGWTHNVRPAACYLKAVLVPPRDSTTRAGRRSTPIPPTTTSTMRPRTITTTTTLAPTPTSTSSPPNCPPVDFPDYPVFFLIHMIVTSTTNAPTASQFTCRVHLSWFGIKHN